MGAGGAQVDADLGHGLDDGRVDVVGRGGAGGADDDPVAGVVGEQGGGHLGAAGVVDADEQDLGAGGQASVASDGGGGRGSGSRPKATAAPMSCMTMNIGAEDGAMPAKVSDRVRAMVTAGLAKLVDDVKQ